MRFWKRSSELLIAIETTTYVRPYFRSQYILSLDFISAVVWSQKNPYWTNLRVLLKDHPVLLKWEEAPTDLFDIDRIKPGVVHMDVDEDMLGTYFLKALPFGDSITSHLF